MKSIRALVALFLLAVFLAGTAHANTSSVNPNVPAQNSPLSSSVLRGNFANAQSDINTIFGILALSSNELLGTVNAGNAGPLNLPTCSTGALSWTPGTGFGCNSLSGLVSPITQNLVFTGQIGISLNATALPTKQVGTVLQLGNADTVASRIENDAFAAAAYFTGIRSDGTNASPTTLQNLDEISGINAWGYNGSSIVGPRASVREFAAQNWTGSAQGTRIDISTTLNNTTTMAPVCGFENDGGVTCPPTVTGGDMGAGRINAAGLYVNGVAVSTGSNALSSITAALANNSIENGGFTSTWNYDTITTQTALSLSSTGVSTGQIFNATVNNAGSTGYAGYFTNNGTAAAYGIFASETGASNTGYAGYFSNTATATGYALYANGTAKIAGNLTVTGTCTGCGSGATGTTGQVAYFSAANTVSGSSALFQSTSGSVGIGTTTPGSPLSVIGFGTTGNYAGSAAYFGGSTTYGTGITIDASSTSGGDAWQISSSNTAGSCPHCFLWYDLTATYAGLAVETTSTIDDLMVLSNGVFGWNTGTQYMASTLDTGISRDAADVVDVGNGVKQNTSGRVKAAAYISAGTKFTASGCSNSATTGGATAGTITLGANSCTITVTMGSSATAPNGWHCAPDDRTTTGIKIDETTAGSTTTAVFSVPSGAGATDVVGFACIAF